jgi:hypothetical protein
MKTVTESEIKQIAKDSAENCDWGQEINLSDDSYYAIETLLETSPRNDDDCDEELFEKARDIYEEAFIDRLTELGLIDEIDLPWIFLKSDPEEDK